jgi:hypothetical protein
MTISVNPEHLSDLVNLYERIKPLAALDFFDSDDLYIDGSIVVRSANGYELGRFYIEDDFWVFVVSSQ